MKKSAMLMQAKGLSAGYNGEAVFRGLDLKFPEGSITTLIGSNGSGKSTIQGHAPVHPVRRTEAAPCHCLRHLFRPQDIDS